MTDSPQLIIGLSFHRTITSLRLSGIFKAVEDTSKDWASTECTNVSSDSIEHLTIS